MTGLHRTDLTTSQKIQCAAQALAQQGEHGSKTRLSRAYEISRPTVYAAGETAEAVLRWHFEGRLVEGGAVDVRVDDAQLCRALVGLRAMAPNSIRAIRLAAGAVPGGEGVVRVLSAGLSHRVFPDLCCDGWT